MVATSYFVHEASYVDDDVQIGAGTKVRHSCHIQRGARLGSNCSLGQNVNIGNNVRIGNGVRIQNNVSIYEGVELEDNVFCGPSCVFTNVVTPRAHFPVHGVYAKTLIKEGASLGANSTVVCGHTVGRSALVAASSGTSNRLGVRMRTPPRQRPHLLLRPSLPRTRRSPFPCQSMILNIVAPALQTGRKVGR